MKKHQLKKDQRLQFLLQKMSVEPLNRHQMADLINMNTESVSRYITELRFKKKIHIARYDRTDKGSYAVYYMTGNFPDVVKPVPLTQKEYNDRYKQKTAEFERRTQRKVKFVPHPDYASAWLFNPIKHD